MARTGFTLFDTTIGRCALAWGERGIVGVQLPERSEARTRGRLQRRFPEAREAQPPPDVARVLDDIVALLRGERVDLAPVRLDMDRVPSFDRRVYEIARTIPPGGTRSYGEIADRLGTRGASRAVGRALGRNPFPIVVPCHRVLAAGGKPGGFSASGGVTTKLRILAIEGARTNPQPGLFDGERASGADPGAAARGESRSKPGGAPRRAGIADPGVATGTADAAELGGTPRRADVADPGVAIGSTDAVEPGGTTRRAGVADPGVATEPVDAAGPVGATGHRSEPISPSRSPSQRQRARS